MFLGTIDVSCRADVLDLALLIAESDNEFSDSEKAVIDAYKHEMYLSKEPQKMELSAILDSLAPADGGDKRRILFEMAALVIADGSYSGEERKIIEKIAASFGIGDDFITRSIEIIGGLNARAVQAGGKPG